MAKSLVICRTNPLRWSGSMGHPMAATPEGSLAHVIEQHLTTVWNFCSRMTLSTADAVEATFETFERASQSPHPPAEPKDMELWLLKIAAHVIEKRLPPT